MVLDVSLFLDAPFITSLVKKKTAPPPQQTSSALESFMKFDRKYGVKGSTLAAAAAKTDSETEPEISEEPKSPSRIASELEEKVRVRQGFSKFFIRSMSITHNVFLTSDHHRLILKRTTK